MGVIKHNLTDEEIKEKFGVDRETFDKICDEVADLQIKEAVKKYYEDDKKIKNIFSFVSYFLAITILVLVLILLISK